ncbi:MAG: SET domain-containing protein-lysine N-methyltransferase [Bacteroidota bacterium]
MKQNNTATIFKVLFSIRNAKSKIHGMGAYADELIPARKKIGSLGGVVISKREADRRSKLNESIAIVELWNGKALDATINSNELRYVNHSCGPNTYMRVINNHVEFYALKNIKKGVELTCNYGLTHHEGTLPCKCGAKNCKGFI